MRILLYRNLWDGHVGGPQSKFCQLVYGLPVGILPHGDPLGFAHGRALVERMVASKTERGDQVVAGLDAAALAAAVVGVRGHDRAVVSAAVLAGNLAGVAQQGLAADVIVLWESHAMPRI